MPFHPKGHDPKKRKNKRNKKQKKISSKIKKLLEEGKSKKQAVAIALEMSRRNK